MTGWGIWQGISCGRDEEQVFRGKSSVVSFRMAESEAQGRHRVAERPRRRGVGQFAGCLYGEIGTSGVVSINAVGNFGFSRTVDLKTRSVDVAISEPQGQKIRVRMQPMNDDLGYSFEGPSRPGARN